MSAKQLRLTAAQISLLQFVQRHRGVTKSRIAGNEWRRLDALERWGLVERCNEPFLGSYFLTDQGVAALSPSQHGGQG